MTIAEYIIEKLKNNNCKHVIGIPGTTCADFFDAMDRDKDISYIIPANELEAGYIADGYGRYGEISALCVSYGVGTLSLVNAVASAYTERVPIIVINGGPTSEDITVETSFGSLFSHSTGEPDTDLKVFEHITVYAKIMSDLRNVRELIDEAFLQATIQSRPVYIEIPQDYWNLDLERTDIQYSYFLNELQKVINCNADEVLIIAGVEIVRKKLQDITFELINKSGADYATTTLSKSFVSEGSNSKFIGCFDNDTYFKENSRLKDLSKYKLILSLGNIWGIDHRGFVIDNYSKMVNISFNAARIGFKTFREIDIEVILGILIDKADNLFAMNTLFSNKRKISDAYRKPSNLITHDNLFAAIEVQLLKNNKHTQLVLDTCLASFPGADVSLKNSGMYLSNPIWLSIGQSVPAAIGAYLKNNKKPLIVTGDGGFQMVMQTFGTMVKYKIPALIIVIDNASYAIEQFLLDQIHPEHTDEYNYVDVRPWNYHNLPEVFNGGSGYCCSAISELIEKLNDWFDNAEHITEPCIISCKIPKDDLPGKLKRKTINKGLNTFRLR